MLQVQQQRTLYQHQFSLTPITTEQQLPWCLGYNVKKAHITDRFPCKQKSAYHKSSNIVFMMSSKVNINEAHRHATHIHSCTDSTFASLHTKPHRHTQWDKHFLLDISSHTTHIHSCTDSIFASLHSKPHRHTQWDKHLLLDISSHTTHIHPCTDSTFASLHSKPHRHTQWDKHFLLDISSHTTHIHSCTDSTFASLHTLHPMWGVPVFLNNKSDILRFRSVPDVCNYWFVIKAQCTWCHLSRNSASF